MWHWVIPLPNNDRQTHSIFYKPSPRTQRLSLNQRESLTFTACIELSILYVIIKGKYIAVVVQLKAPIHILRKMNLKSVTA